MDLFLLKVWSRSTGSQLPNIQVVFDQPELSANENIGYAGKTDEQGRYVLKPAGKDGAGAPPGKYRVSLSTAYDPSAPTPPNARRTTIFVPAEPPPPPERVPANQRQQSFEVPADGTDQANFDLKSK